MKIGTGGLNMDDLISREALYEAMQALRGVGRAYVWDPDEVLATIEKAPSAVVRCEECKHWRHSGNNIFGPEYGTCVESLMDTTTDFYCGYGERRDNEEKNG